MNILNETYKESVSSEIDSYLQTCREAVACDEFFSKFKSLEPYRVILEHVNYEQGIDYINEIASKNKKYLEKEYMDIFISNDKIGSPNLCYYDQHNINAYVSPSTFRYIKVLTDVEQLCLNFDNFNIVEIGGGYGGQCKIFFDIYHENIQSYTIVDLDDVIKLIDKYLTATLSTENRKKIKFIPVSDINTINNFEPASLFISNYAFSECSHLVRNNYIKNILSKCKYGYVTVNYFTPVERREFNSDLTMFNLTVTEENEIPLTSSNNYILTWKP